MERWRTQRRRSLEYHRRRTKQRSTHERASSDRVGPRGLTMACSIPRISEPRRWSPRANAARLPPLRRHPEKTGARCFHIGNGVSRNVLPHVASRRAAARDRPLVLRHVGSPRRSFENRRGASHQGFESLLLRQISLGKSRVRRVTVRHIRAHYGVRFTCSHVEMRGNG